MSYPQPVRRVVLYVEDPDTKKLVPVDLGILGYTLRPLALMDESAVVPAGKILYFRDYVLIGSNQYIYVEGDLKVI